MGRIENAARPIILLCCVCIRCRGNVLPNRCLATIGIYTYRHTDWWEGFAKYAVEMGSDAMIYIARFITIGSGIQKLMGGGGYTDSMVIANAYFYFFKIRKVG
jgi:hypothetical protein